MVFGLNPGIEVERARPDQIDVLADVLGDAFADYPWTRFTVAADDHHRRVRDLQRIAFELLGFDHADVWAASVGTEIVGTAVFSDSRAPAPDAVYEELQERSVELIGDRLDASLEADAAATALVPDFPHMSLDVVGVHSRWQRRGIGAAVIEPGLAEADRMGLPTRLDTSTHDNLRFYERLGFTVTHHVDLGGVDLWAMLRPPG